MHTLLILLCCRLPLYDELMKRLLTFTQTCVNCETRELCGKVCCMVWSHGVSTRLQRISVLL